MGGQRTGDPDEIKAVNLTDHVDSAKRPTYLSLNPLFNNMWKT